MRTAIGLAAALGIAVGAACSLGPGSPSPSPSTNTSTTTSTPAMHDAKGRLPEDPGAFAPSHLHVDGNANGSQIAEVESCAGCHADAAAQWRTSAHAFGSFNNPIYRVAVDRFRTEIGKEQSRFCGGCHDVALTVEGAMSGEVAPNDPRAHGGVTCRVCHNAGAATSDGNASLTLRTDAIAMPKEGDAESLRLHKERMALAPLKTAKLCGGCHRAFLEEATGNPVHLVGQNELGEWGQSLYNGSLAQRIDENVEETDCKGCHMKREAAPGGDVAAKDGKIASHRFLGAHTWLAAMRGDAEQLARVEENLKGAASIDVPVLVHADGTRALPADGAALTPGESVTLDVVVRNEHVGHRFPAGTLDAQDVWIELEVRDARGKVLADAGTRQAETGDDVTAHRLRALQADENGTPLLTRETHRFRTVVFNHTIPARDAELVRYRFDVPRALDAAQLPLRVTARLRHRSRNLQLFGLTCADAKTPRGAAFTQEVKKRTTGTFNPCAPEPITEVATREIEIGAPSTRKHGEPAWRRLWIHGMGAIHSLQEHLDEARPSLERALALLAGEASPSAAGGGAPRSGSDREKAMVMGLYAEIAIKEGRTEEALDWIDQASRLVPDHPALPRMRGDALAAVWRWKEAVAPYREATKLAPRDSTAWVRLSLACGSAGLAPDALEAARQGLNLAPRDPDMLRVQALALETLQAAPDEIARARAAFLAYRTPDEAPEIRSKCASSVPGCALERIPVHVHAMRAR